MTKLEDLTIKVGLYSKEILNDPLIKRTWYITVGSLIVATIDKLTYATFTCYEVDYKCSKKLISPKLKRTKTFDGAVSLIYDKLNNHKEFSIEPDKPQITFSPTAIFGPVLA